MFYSVISMFYSIIREVKFFFRYNLFVRKIKYHFYWLIDLPKDNKAQVFFYFYFYFTFFFKIEYINVDGHFFNLYLVLLFLGNNFYIDFSN